MSAVGRKMKRIQLSIQTQEIFTWNLKTCYYVFRQQTDDLGVRIKSHESAEENTVTCLKIPGKDDCVLVQKCIPFQEFPLNC